VELRAVSAGCLDENAVMEFVQGRLDSAQRRKAEEHIDGCEECRTLVARVGQLFLTEPANLSKSMDEITAPDFGSGEPPPPGTRLANRFRLERVLGRGAMGQVYEAFDEHLKVPVALKLLVPELRSEPSFLKDMQREVQVARKITHPNVCRVYDLGSDGEVSFISMELIDGETLEKLLAKRRLPRAEVAQILEQVCAALEAAHQEGVVHRDLKPGNIMIDAGGKVTVMDFGLARDLQGAASVRSGPIGTPAYWAPEQARGDETTFRTDLYAVGVVAYELFVGQRLPHVVQEGQALEEIPHGYQSVVRTCLQLKPERRFGSATALKRALVSARLAPEEAHPPALRRRFVMGLGVATGFLVAALVLRLSERGRPPTAVVLSPPPHAAEAPPPPAPVPPPLAPPQTAETAPPEEPTPDEAPSQRGTRTAPPRTKPARRRAAETKPMDRDHIPVFE
jgi:predicted Ser/Thr protein kinase